MPRPRPEYSHDGRVGYATTEINARAPRIRDTGVSTDSEECDWHYSSLILIPAYKDSARLAEREQCDSSLDFKTNSFARPSGPVVTSTAHFWDLELIVGE